MALGATVYQFDIALADSDRGVFEQLQLRPAMHPSESPAYLLSRVLAACLHWRAGLGFAAGGVSSDEPPVSARSLDGRLELWIEIGLPDAQRLHKAAKAAAEVAVYTHRRADRLLSQLAGKRIHRAGEIPILAFEPALIEAMLDALERRNALTLTRSGEDLFVEFNGRSLHGRLIEHRIPS